MLELENVSVAQDGKTLVDRVSLSVSPGQVTALLGANGAGKSELVLGVAGLLPVTGGKIVADGKDVTNAKPDAIRSVGVAAVPEGHQVLTMLSVEDNLMAAASQLSVAEAQSALSSVLTIFPELVERRRQLAGSMSGGQQQMLAIGHALMVNPRYLLIDEMSLGLAPLIVKRLVAVVKQLVSTGTGVLLVEQFVEVALGLADRVVVLRKGAVRLDTRPADIMADRTLLTRAYL
jgi:branched-chain amino acid transport system ATP-binding protein